MRSAPDANKRNYFSSNITKKKEKPNERQWKKVETKNIKVT